MDIIYNRVDLEKLSFSDLIDMGRLADDESSEFLKASTFFEQQDDVEHANECYDLCEYWNSVSEHITEELKNRIQSLFRQDFNPKKSKITMTNRFDSDGNLMQQVKAGDILKSNNTADDHYLFVMALGEINNQYAGLFEGVVILNTNKKEEVDIQGTVSESWSRDKFDLSSWDELNSNYNSLI